MTEKSNCCAVPASWWARKNQWLFSTLCVVIRTSMCEHKPLTDKGSAENRLFNVRSTLPRVAWARALVRKRVVGFFDNLDVESKQNLKGFVTGSTLDGKKMVIQGVGILQLEQASG